MEGAAFGEMTMSDHEGFLVRHHFPSSTTTLHSTLQFWVIFLMLFCKQWYLSRKKGKIKENPKWCLWGISKMCVDP